MSELNHNPDFETDLAQAAKPEELGNEQVDTLNDPTESLRIGLVNLYYNYSGEIVNQLKSGLIDENKAKELTAQVDGLSLADLGYEISKGIPLEIAKEIMGAGSFFGPQEVKKAFGIEITEKLPPIPFIQEELLRAKELGQFLVLRVDHAEDGQPLTMEKIASMLQPKFNRDQKGPILFSASWCKEEIFYINSTPKLEWALTSTTAVPSTNLIGYLSQTQALANHLCFKVFRDTRMPEAYWEAIAEFEKSRDEIGKLVISDLSAASLKLSQLKINQLTRQSPVEALYDVLIYFQNTDERLLEDTYTLTRILDSDLKLVYIGGFNEDGIGIGAISPIDIENGLGVIFSRTK